MPESPPRRCPQCLQLLKGRCPDCDGWSNVRPASWPGSSANDPRWRKVRAERLAREPWCRECGEPATQADHLDPTDYTDDSGHGASWALALHDSLTLPCLSSQSNRQTRRRRTTTERILTVKNQRHQLTPLDHSSSVDQAEAFPVLIAPLRKITGWAVGGHSFCASFSRGGIPNF
jgi:hypothetical protein